jgi:6-pyruvoyltetrahydropterin/6-carboxytetrahydropterin synthase
MPYRICKVFDVESGHQLAKHPEKCRFPHGHSRRIEVVLEAATLDANDMVCDFAAIKSAAQELIESYDHALCVNTRDPMFATLKQAYGAQILAFADKDPTTEVLARAMFDAIRANLRAQTRRGGRCAVRRSVRLVRVRIWETPRGWAEYAG